MSMNVGAAEADWEETDTANIILTSRGNMLVCNVYENDFSLYPHKSLFLKKGDEFMIRPTLRTSFTVTNWSSSKDELLPGLKVGGENSNIRSFVRYKTGLFILAQYGRHGNQP